MARPLAFPDYPGVSTYTDRKGETRFRFRKGGKDTTIDGEMGSPEFIAAYQACLAAITRQSASKAMVLEHPKAAHIGKKTFRHAWLLLQDSIEWAGLKEENTQSYNRTHIEAFLQSEIDPKFAMTWGDAPMADVDAEYLQNHIDDVFRRAPTTNKHRLVAIRKLYTIAVEKMGLKPEENRAAFVKSRKPPETDANPPWPQEYLDRFEAAYPLGSKARTCFEMAIGLGARCCDLHKLGPNHVESKVEIDPDGSIARRFHAIRWHTTKTRKGTLGEVLYHEITERLAKALVAVERQPGQTFLITRFGTPYQIASLGTEFRRWCDKLDIPMGYTLHGLRHTFATEMAGQVDAVAIQKAMGHKRIEQTMHYIRRAEKEQLAKQVAQFKNGTRTQSVIKTVPNLKVVG